MNKIYLSGIQEITKALKDGKVVFEEDTANKVDKYRAIRLINGILISSYVGKTHVSIFMNDYICLNGGDSKFYYEEKEPIKLEVGKFYRTREGKKCICIYIDGDEYEFRVLNEKNSFWVGFDGASNHNAMQDIVDYWEEQNGNN